MTEPTDTLLARVAVLEAELAAAKRVVADAVGQQTATSEILRVISRSPSDVQPVFDAIAENAARLVQAWSVTVLRWDGRFIHLVAERGGPPGSAQLLRDESPWLPNTTSGTGRCIATGTVIHVPDVDLDPEADTATRALARKRGWRSDLNVPMLRGRSPIGAISVTRVEAGPFSPAEIELLQTFADQAVIAIENVRLFNELQEKNRELTAALEQQTATSDILRVIADSPTDVQPVLDAVAEHAARLCGADDALVHRVESETMRLVAHFGAVPYAPESVTRPIAQGAHSGRAIRERRVIHVHDMLEPQARAEYPDVVALGIGSGTRTVLAVPLLREGVAIGVIVIRRREVRPFDSSEIDLVRTFADQAVIAIENVRLFNELQQRNRDLTDALAQQTATSEVLRAISRSPTEIQPVFDVIARSAAQLCEGYFAVVFVSDGQRLHVGATHNLPASWAHEGKDTFPAWLDGDTQAALAVRERRIVHVLDMQEDADVSPGSRRRARVSGYRTWIGVPMLGGAAAVGTIGVARKERKAFSDNEIALLNTFAAQAVIAIENVRLFTALQERTAELQVANRHKDEFLANMSHELRTPLNGIIGFSEVLLERMFGDINDKQDEYLKDIVESGRHLLSLINDILDLSKIEAGRMELELSDFDLPAAIDDAMLLMRERAGRRGIALRRHVDDGVGDIRADQRKVKQVLLNLLSNAVKFTPEGGRITVGASLAEGAVVISVIDSGIGIAPEDHDAVFEEFRQVGKPEKKAEGTGLGLALCRKFVQLHGGRIWLASEVGEGSTFSFSIPVGGPAAQPR